MDKVKINGDLTERELLVARRAAEGVLRRLKPELHALLGAVALALTISIVGGVIGWIVVGREGRERVNAIQASRYKTTRDNCLDTNERHRAALGELKKATEVLPGDQRLVRAYAKATRAQIDAQLPLRPDCMRFARGRVYALPKN